MKLNNIAIGMLAAVFLLAGQLLASETARAHCDTLDGPVVQEARKALAAGNVTPVLKWVRGEDEQEIRAAFARTLVVRSKGEEARELADTYFFETLVRIHRAGEGAPYTGLKSADSIDHAVLLADQALAEGNVDQLVTVLTGAMGEGIRTRFQETLASKKHADDSVAAGREFVKNYVIFTHYAEGLHTMLKGGRGQEENASTEDAQHGHGR